MAHKKNYTYEIKMKHTWHSYETVEITVEAETESEAMSNARSRACNESDSDAWDAQHYDTDVQWCNLKGITEISEPPPVRCDKTLPLI